ncbi:LuxR family transcriptional regulator [Paenibacillus yonginensis]|uniref:LuxR family transcriptional regulator n=1 Tax=Paenibacillus yonginensis TaxID=1462996 RepID=A0A1B1N555_9BACL|nr:response regulator transcription factor [Paenibacillus yonginensis]ANS76563.1 LuxR family transcriptional regulator [Paenibacillus yonginensis]
MQEEDILDIWKPIRIVLAEDQLLIRESLRFILNHQEDMEVVGEAGDGEEAVEVAQKTRPDLMLMDVQMPKATGLEATVQIVKQLPGVKIVLLTTFDIQDYVFDGIRAGACGYLLKDTPTKELLSSIRAISAGAALFNSKQAGSVMSQFIALKPEGPEAESNTEGENVPQAFLLEPLTEREKEVLQQMGYGKKNGEIAATLYVSEGTVKTHVHNIIQKLGARDRTQAVVLAIRSGLID